MTERSIFLDALEIGDLVAREAYLDEATRRDPALRQRVDDLLAAHAEALSFMDRPAPGSSLDSALDPVDSPPPPAGPGVGASGLLLADRYVVGEEIGRGGMGTVYRAEQLRPVRRSVAVKLINLGMDSRHVLARFEAERQALAVMDHPHIAKVLDAGATPDGRPFFVMELVPGVPLTDYCDAHRLPMAGRLELFRQVCGAVQHAHQKGVIHRDIKPSNVLVEDHDGVPVPKVIDFGLAKAIGDTALTDHTLVTVPGSVAGTPLYMAPEQAGPEAGDVDTRADVYSLGAVLYELLSGSPPIGRETLRQAALHEVLRVIREDDPQPPSSRLGSSADLPTVAVNRGTEPARLGRFVSGDLDWVAMKALEKDRGRRYVSAAALADDVGRFLNHEPVAAGPPTIRYRAGKFLRRNRAAAVAVSFMALSLIVGIIGIAWGLVEARHQRDDAVAARLTESAERMRAETNLAYAKQGNQILGSIFAGLSPEKIAESGRPLQDVLRENLQAAVKALDGSAIGDPLAVAEMQQTLGISLRALGAYELASTLLSKVEATRAAQLGRAHPATLGSMNNLADIHRIAGRADLAVPLFERTLASMRSILGPDHFDTLSCMINLGLAYTDAGRFAEAIAVFEPALASRKARLGPDHPETLLAMNSLGVGYLEVGRFPDAVSLFEATLALRKARLGPDHPHTLNTMDNLATGYTNLGRVGEAIPLAEESLRRTRARLGPDHPDTIVAMNNLGNLYRTVRQIDRALPLHEEALRHMRAKFGSDHPTTLRGLSNLAGDHWMAGRYDQSVPLLEESLALRKAKLGSDHPDVLAAMNSLASSYRDSGQIDKAILMYDQAIRGMETQLGRAHFKTQTAIGNLGMAYLYANRVPEALPLLEETHHASRTNPGLRWVGRFLLDAYARSGRREEPLRLVPELVAEARRTLPAESPELSSVLAECSLMLLKLNAFVEAEPLLRECLKIREKVMRETWGTSNTRSQLGGALLGQRKFAEAEPLLIHGYEGLKQRESSIPPQATARVSEAIDRLVMFSEALSRPQDVARWKAERAQYPPSPPSGPVR